MLKSQHCFSLYEMCELWFLYIYKEENVSSTPANALG